MGIVELLHKNNIYKNRRKVEIHNILNKTGIDDD